MPALTPALRGWTGRKAGVNAGTTRHLSGRSVRVLAFGLAFVFSASRMTRRERGGGKVSQGGLHGTFGVPAGGGDLKMDYVRMKLEDGHCKTPTPGAAAPELGISRSSRTAQRSEAESGTKRFGSVARCACDSVSGLRQRSILRAFCLALFGVLAGGVS